MRFAEVGRMSLTITSLILLLIVAGICGSIGQSIGGGGRGGIIVSIALGFIGAVFGTWMAAAMHLPEVFTVRVGGEAFPIVWSIIGAAVFVAILSLLTRSRRSLA